MRIFGIILFGLVITSCAPVQQQSSISSPIGQTLSAGVGDIVLRAEGRESMPNAFGNADIFGRTRPAGFTTIQFGGMQSNKVVLLRSGVTTQSDATTMNSTPLIVPTAQQSTTSGNIGSTPISATTTTTGAAYIPARGSTSVSSEQPTIPIVVDWRANPRIPAEGKTIVIEAATPVSLTYRIE
jgi:hypothetical protein